MAILLNKTTLSSGEQLSAQTINDISETAVAAYQKASEATEGIEELINRAIGQALNSEV